MNKFDVNLDNQIRLAIQKLSLMLIAGCDNYELVQKLRNNLYRDLIDMKHSLSLNLANDLVVDKNYLNDHM